MQSTQPLAVAAILLECIPPRSCLVLGPLRRCIAALQQLNDFRHALGAILGIFGETSKNEFVQLLRDVVGDIFDGEVQLSVVLKIESTCDRPAATTSVDGMKTFLPPTRVVTTWMLGGSCAS